MPTITIRSRDLAAPIAASLEPGAALLLGRAPDPARIDWSALPPGPSDGDEAHAAPDPADYALQTLVIPSARTSANHLLVLQRGAVTSIHDLGSRNGSWVKVEPQHPVRLHGGIEVSCLVGTAQKDEPLLRPCDATWQSRAEFGAAVAAAIEAWLLQVDAPVRVVRHDPGQPSDRLALADGSTLEFAALGTLQIPASALYDRIGAYVHDQNARYTQIERRIVGMVAGSAAIRQILMRTAEAAAYGRRTILLGPTGAGKELLARSYHAYSPRHAGPFVSVNCALLDKELLFAQLFGARRGSFTGAIADVVGLVEVADGGTLFLDELGEMSMDVQKALLRFLDARGEYHRLGDPHPRHSDVQLVCASNAPLHDPDHRSHRFRDDLWYRLAACVIAVPPLRDRPDDIRAFLYARTLHDTDRPVIEFLTEDAIALVVADPWPGNFRDLENFIARLPPATAPHSIDRATCMQAISEGRPQRSAPALAEPAGPPAEPAAAREPAAAPAAPPLKESARSFGRARTDPSVPSNQDLGWDRIAHGALAAFLQDQGDKRAGWEQLQLFVERYLKPVFVAHTADASQSAGTERTVNYSALARRLNIADGSTVKTHLARFEERFARSTPDKIEDDRDA